MAAYARLRYFGIDLEGALSTATGGEVGTEIRMDDDHDTGFLPSAVGVSAFPGNLIMQEILIELMSAMALARPR